MAVVASFLNQGDILYTTPLDFNSGLWAGYVERGLYGR
jgi:hypothetical protein